MPELQQILLQDLPMSKGGVNFPLNPAELLQPQMFPNWSRDGNTNHSYQQRVNLHRNQQTALISDRSDSAIDSSSATARESEHGFDVNKFHSMSANDAQQRVRAMENRIEFLTRQHDDMLQSLHAEVDLLKRRNRELQAELVLLQSQSDVNKRPKSGSSRRASRPSTRAESGSPTKRSATHAESGSPTKRSTGSAHISPSPDLCSSPLTNTRRRADSAETKSRCDCKDRTEEDPVVRASLERQMKELWAQRRAGRPGRLGTADTANKKEEFGRHRGRGQSTGNLYSTTTAAAAASNVLPPVKVRHAPPPHSQLVDFVPGRCLIGSSLPFNASMEPFLVQIGTRSWRPPTVEECQIIVRSVLEENYRLRRETSNVKHDLEDVQQKKSREASECDAASVAASEITSPLPISLTQRSPGARPIRSASPVSLPPIIPPTSTRTAEQIKRSQFLTKRLKQSTHKSDYSKETKKP